MMPRLIRKSLNAMIKPYIGSYMNSTSQISAGSSSTYSCQLRSIFLIHSDLRFFGNALPCTVSIILAPSSRVCVFVVIDIS